MIADRTLWSVLDDLEIATLNSKRGASAILDFALNEMNHQLVRNKLQVMEGAGEHDAEISADAVHWMADALEDQLIRAKELVDEAVSLCRKSAA
jgi:hypothetical protein